MSFDPNIVGHIANLKAQERARRELEKQTELLREEAERKQSESDQTRTVAAQTPTGSKAKKGISGSCVACDMIISFEAPTCPHCGQLNAGEKVAAAEALANARAQVAGLLNRHDREVKAAAEAIAIDEQKAKRQSAIVEAAIRKELKKPTGELTKADLEKVTELRLRSNQLTDLPKGVKNLTQLKKLYLHRNKLTSVKGLKKLTKLEGLYLDGNKLTDAKGLEKLTQLKELFLIDNPDLTKVQIDQLQKALPKCNIGSNPKK